MKKVHLLSWLVLFISLFPSILQAQSYDELWKEVEASQKKDLPKTVISVVDKIYTKAKGEKNIPQMMKAYIVRAESRIRLTPDSALAEYDGIRRWAESETDLVVRAALNHIMGSLILDNQQLGTEDDAIRYFRLSLKDKEALGEASAKDFRPMTTSGELSEKYLNDNMFDLLSRQAIDRLSAYRFVGDRRKCVSEALALYDDLITFYGDNNNRQAALLTKEARVLYCWEGAGSSIVREALTPEKAVEELRKLAEEYKDLPVCADVYVKLAHVYRMNNQPLKSVEVAREGIKKYPEHEWVSQLRSYIDFASSPYLSVNIPLVYPKQEADINVTYANLKGVSFELYRLKISPASSLLRGNLKEETLIKNYGTKIASRHYALSPTPDYEKRDTVLHYTLPEAGIYMLKQIPQEAEKGIDYSLLFVSPYQCISIPVSEERKEFVVVDKLTGKPVPGAEVVTYRLNSNEYSVLQVYKTDGKGSAMVDIPRLGRIYYNVRMAGNDFAAISSIGGNASFVRETVQGWKKKVNLFTDRSLYRPGQKVYVSGMVYEQNGDSLRLVKGEKTSLKLYSSERNVAESTASTDDFGVLSGEFVLPQNLLPGTYYVSTDGASAIIKVEEYKRPTFDVVFTPYEDTYNMGDSLTVKGEVKTFAGAPVRMARVRYTVSRTERTWFRMGGINKVELETGEVQTDADGQFRVNMVLTASETTDWGGLGYRYYVYEVQAEVTDDASETQSGSLSLPVGEQSLGLQIRGLSDLVMREKQEKVQFMALNLNGTPVKTEVRYRVFALDQEGNKGKQQLEGKAVAQQSFVPSDLLALPSGKYRIEISATDAQGRTCTAEQDFTLFSRLDTRLPYPAVDWFYQDGNEFSDSAPATLYVGTSEKDVYLLVDVYSGNKRIASQRLTLSDEIKTFSYPYQKMYGDGISVNFAFMRNGSLYSRQATIIRPEPEKKLTLKWETFRDKLQPGSQEEWRMRVTDATGKPVRANLMASLYDASLDKLYQHDWRFNLWFSRPVPWVQAGMLSASQRVGMYGGFPYVRTYTGLDLLNGEYSSLLVFSGTVYTRGVNLLGTSTRMFAKQSAGDVVEVKSQPIMTVEESAVVAAPNVISSNFKKDSGSAEVEDVLQIVENDAAVEAAEDEEAMIPVRENFAETAFFYPNLRTDSLGGVSIVFTMPDALTEWKFTGLAHTQAVDYGILTQTVKTSKPFMVQPNMPRFVRKGDRTVIAASLVNLSMDKIEGNAGIKLYDPVTEEVVYDYQQPFSVAEGTTGVVRFDCQIPDTYDMLVCRITAEAGEYSDGEQHYLPVLTDKQWMTETVPVQLDGESMTEVGTEDLFNKQSKTATERRLTVELTANPDWYAVQALPVVGNPTEEDALSWATAYYANSLASAIVKANPRIKQVFDTWMAQGGSKETLLSNLERNQDLKNLLLEETPWISEATEESEQKRRIALLFDLNSMDNRLRTSIERLQELQLSDGSWSWYRGMTGSRYITTQIVEMLARLQHMNVTLDGKVAPMYTRALGYLQKAVKEDYETMKKLEKEGATTLVPNSQVVHYLYVCALDKQAALLADKQVNAYMTDRLENRSAEYSIGEKAMIGLIMQAGGRQRQAQELVQSIKEYTVSTPQMGVYFDTPKAPYSWNNYRIPAQVAAMEAIQQIAPDADMLAGMKLWLLKQKQVQVWESSIATADAVYAFLNGSGNRLQVNGTMKAVAGNVEVRTPDDVLGYTRKTLTGTDTHVERVVVSKSGTGIGWGAVYAQYLEEMDKVLPAKGNGVSVAREWWMDGKQIFRKTVLHAGDKMTVRLTIKADRDMDFIRVKDERAACMEPDTQLSGYRWSNGLGYYQVNRDASTEFFIDRMPKGTYTLEYTVYLDRSGTYQAGAATIQSVYAPEFSGRTGGQTLTVE